VRRSRHQVGAITFALLLSIILALSLLPNTHSFFLSCLLYQVRDALLSRADCFSNITHPLTYSLFLTLYRFFSSYITSP
jgi:hypothetical protein